MKQKSNSFILVLALVGFVACSWMSNQLYGWKSTVSPSDGKVPTQFYAGMDKFLSNISWMTLIQWQADGMQGNSTAVADKLYDKLNALTNLDPLFTDAYLDGALSLASVHPDQSLKLLDKAMVMGLDKNWKVPFYAGQICTTSAKDYDRAASYFQMAEVCPEAPVYVRTAKLHAECMKLDDEPVASIRIWYKYWESISGPDAEFVTHSAVDQINEYGDTAMADIDKKLQSTTDAGARDSLLHDRSEINDIIKAVNKKPAAPTSQPVAERA